MNHSMKTIFLNYVYQDIEYTYKNPEDKIKIIQELNESLSEIYILLHHNIIFEKYSVQSIIQIIFTKIKRSYHFHMELLKKPISKNINMEKTMFNIYELFMFYFLLLPKTKNEIYDQSIHFYSFFLRFAFLTTNSKFYQDQLTNIYQ